MTEGPRTVIAGIDVQGSDETSNRLVRGELDVEAGKPLDLAALGRTRKNLYDTGAFSLVDITREEVTPGENASPDRNQGNGGDGSNGHGPNQAATDTAESGHDSAQAARMHLCRSSAMATTSR